MQDIKLFKEINKHKLQISTEHQNEKMTNMTHTRNGSQSASHKKFKDHLLSPTSKLMGKGWDTFGDANPEKKGSVDGNITSEIATRKNLKPIFKNNPQGTVDSLTGSKDALNQEENTFKKLEYSSQFKQRSQIKRITNILIQSQKESKEHSIMKLLSPPSPKRREKKSLTNLEKSPPSITINLASKHEKTNITGSNAVEGTGKKNVDLLDVKHQKNTILISKDQAEKSAEKQPEKKNTLKLISDEDFLGSSIDLDQLFFKKTINFGNKKIEEFYEILEDNPTFKTNESPAFHSSKANIEKKMSTLSTSTKFRTLNNDFENMTQLDFSTERILLKFNKIWLSFPLNQNCDTIEEYYEEIFHENILFSKGNIFFYSVFNLFVCLLWLLIHDEIDGFNGFFSTRIVILSLGLICSKYWTKNFPKRFHKRIIFWYYGFTAIQILLFTIMNPQIKIVMEIEFLACYLSFTRYCFINFIESTFASLIFLILHIIYLHLINASGFLMIHSTFALMFFNLVGVHIQIKTQIDNFNKSRINIIKKKQLNNMIVNLLPNHVLEYLNVKLKIHKF